MNMKAILSAINTTLAVTKIRPEKYSFIYESHAFELRFKYMTAIPIFSIAQIYNSRTGMDFFSGLISTTAQVVFITAKNAFIFTTFSNLVKTFQPSAVFRWNLKLKFYLEYFAFLTLKFETSMLKD